MIRKLLMTPQEAMTILVQAAVNQGRLPAGKYIISGEFTADQVEIVCKPKGEDK